ncbi:MAG: hypothetical protein NC336_00935 [Clostridium sp.]|nr:hypothetical protein [Clostridium sp.]
MADIYDTPPVSVPGGAGCGGCGGCNGCGGCGGEEPRGKMQCHDWLADIPDDYSTPNIVEVQFKNTRKGYYVNSTNLDIAMGDMVAVEATPGHDIGQVTLTGRLVLLQMRKANIKRDTPLKRVFRKAKPADLEKFREARSREEDTMIRARKIAENLKLKMKIGDVEYQGDGNKAIFYYIADERVDFRQLIKVLADTFKIRIEMRQIGARQEAGRIGGIGPCGRPLCCASWMSNFVSVGTSAARFQDISLNPQKLAGQCAKLKCCLNFEVDSYVESVKKLPGKEIRLETADSTWYFFKYDIFKGLITYSSDKSVPANLTTIDAERAFEVLELNKRGEKPLKLTPEGQEDDSPQSRFNDILGQDSVTRFDKAKKKKKKNKQRQQGDGKTRGDAQPKAEGQNAKPKNDDQVSQPKNEGQTQQPRQPKRNNQRRRPKEKNQGRGGDGTPGQPRDKQPDKPKE